MGKLSQIYLFLLLIFGLSGCNAFNYYRQAASGQMSLLWQREPIEDVLDAPATTPELRHKLMLAQRARDFARDELALPVGDTFSDYVALDQPYVVYNLMVAPEFSLDPHTWCYPIVGCQSYRGYFHLEDARAAQKRFIRQGDDTFIGGVTAYSTLGWFDDPIHSGFTRLPDDRMVELIFHELAHKQVYVAGDTRFNESFATAVQLEGLKRWLRATGQPDKYQQAQARLERRAQTLALIEKTADQLKALYARHEMAEGAMRARKAALLGDLKAAYRQLEAGWPEPGPLGGVIAHVNNAVLGLFRQYNSDVPAFRQLLADSHGDFHAFYRRVQALADASGASRRDQLDALDQRWQPAVAESGGHQTGH
ncbi:zinc protease [Marinobacter halodurans]|uniref:Zinc protease n=1 Tax=Marinobacter halodurans TaxID=2528979 RepID=A0ABY1ZS65_9GAMM|nr:aminopeptidase [Marinobacter halodurans]TBW58845.1 zinc protease [Marinobacter halodurans]